MADDRLESLRPQEQGGSSLGSLLLFMAASAVAPALVRGALRRGVAALGRSAAAGEARAALQAARAAGLEAEQVLLSEATSVRQRILRAAVLEAEEEAPRVSRFLERIGVRQAGELRRRAEIYERFAAERRSLYDRVRYLRRATPEERQQLLRGAAARFIMEQAVAAPTLYALDRLFGLIPDKGDRPAFYNLPAHVVSFAEWLPSYLGYEAVGRLVRLAGGATMRQAQQIARRARIPQRLGAMLGQAYGRVRAGVLLIEQLESEMAHRYRAGVTDRPRDRARAYLRLLRDVWRERRPRSPLVSRDAYQRRLFRDLLRLVRDDRGLLGALAFFEDAQAASLRQLQRPDEPVRRAFSHLFTAPRPRVARSRFGRATQAREVSLREVERHLLKQYRLLRRRGLLTEELEQEFRRTQEFIQRVKASAREALEVGLHGAHVSPEMRAFLQRYSPERLRVTSLVRMQRRLVPNIEGREVLDLVGRVFTRLTSFRRWVSVGQILQVPVFTERRPDVMWLTGEVPVGRELYRIGMQSGAQYRYGLYVARRSGSARGALYVADEIARAGSHPRYGFRRVSDDLWLFGGGRHAELYAAALRYAGLSVEPEPSLASRMRRDREGPLWRLARRLGLGSRHGELWHRRHAVVGRLAPRKLFGESSPLWSGSPGSFEVVQAINLLAQAWTHGASGAVVEELARAMPRGTTAEAIAQVLLRGGDDELVAMARADLSLWRVRSGAPIRPPSLSHVQAILDDVSHLGRGALYNVTGERRTDVLRRYLLESALLQASEGDPQLFGRLQTRLEEAVRAGRLRKEQAEMARAGLVYLEARTRTGFTTQNPFEVLLRETGDALPQHIVVSQRTGSTLGDVLGVLRERRGVLEEFARTRPLFDTRWHMRAFTAPGAPAVRGRYFLASGADLAQVMLKRSMASLRRVFDEIGLGWDAATTSKGLDLLGELGLAQRDPVTGRLQLGVWPLRAAVFVGGALAWRAADTLLDVALPDWMPLGEGLNVSLASWAAMAREIQAAVLQTTGVTSVARYLESLLPRSSEYLPGMLLGGLATRSFTGALVGGALQRMLTAQLRDTPFEVIMPPLYMDYEEVRQEMTGERMVPVRRGRGFLLSTGDIAGGRIVAWRPSWYQRVKADLASSELLYGSDLAELIFKPLPLLDFAPGDLLDPHYLERRQYFQRPYYAPRIPFSEMPVLGPLLGQTLGRLYLALHPLGTTRPLHMEAVVGSFAGEGLPGAPVPHSGRGPSWALDPRPLVYEGIPTGVDTQVAFDEQFYRLTEAVGFQGFLLQTIAGGEGLHRGRILPSASEMISPARFIHDQNLGDFLGMGEALRRLYPFMRDAERVGPPNLMPEWMPEELRQGDPYCLLPDVRMELDHRLVTAEEAYRLVSEGGTHRVRTHRGRIRRVEAAAVREVDEEIVVVRFREHPWELRVTKAHPVLVLVKGLGVRWKLAGELTEEDRPVIPCGYDPLPKQAVEPLDGTMAIVIMELLRVHRAHNHMLRLGAPEDEDLDYWLRTTSHYNGERVGWLTRGRLRQLIVEARQRGLPLWLIGAGDAFWRTLLLRYGRVVWSYHQRFWGGRGNYAVLEITPERFGLSPDLSDEERERALEQTAYVVFHGLLQAGAVGRLERTEQGWRYVLAGREFERLFYAEDWDEVGGRWCRLATSARMLRFEWRGRLRTGAALEIAELRTEHYRGPVYSFQVQGDSSFVAAAVATHNSKVISGEYVLPGPVYERMRGVEPTRLVSASDVGLTLEETVLRMLDIATDTEESWADRAVRQMLIDAGIAVREDVVYFDEQANLFAVADAATVGNLPIIIETVPSPLFQSGMIHPLHRERINTILGAARRKAGFVYYVDAETGELRTFMQHFDAQLYSQTVQRLHQARRVAQRLAAEGYGAPGALYGPLDRMEVLLSAAPYSPEARQTERLLEAMAEKGALTPREMERYEELKRRRYLMSLPFEVFPERFSMTELLDPDPYYTMLNFNRFVKAAASYTLPERLVGMLGEMWANLRTPLHTKFFGAPDIETAYITNVLLGRDFQDWRHPIRDFARSWAAGLLAVETPYQGAISWAMGAGGFLSPALAPAAAALGAVVGAAGAVLPGVYVPENVEEMRELEHLIGMVRYERARQMLAATGQRQYLEQMERTPLGFERKQFGRVRFTPPSGLAPAPLELPPAVLTAFPSAPGSERRLLLAFLSAQEREDQERIRALVSEDMQRVLNRAWEVLYGAPGEALAMPAPPEVPAELLMPGASVDQWGVRLVEDAGLDAHDTGLGWRDTELRLREVMGAERSVAQAMDPGRILPRAATAAELRLALRSMLQDLGIGGEVIVFEGGGPVEVIIRSV